MRRASRPTGKGQQRKAKRSARHIRQGSVQAPVLNRHNLRLQAAQELGSGLRILHLLLLDGLHFVDQIVGSLKVGIASFGVGFGVSLLAI